MVVEDVDVVVVEDVAAPEGSDVSGTEEAEVVLVLLVMVVGAAMTSGSDVSFIAGATDVKVSTAEVLVVSDATVSVMVGCGTTEALSPSLLLSLPPGEQPAARIRAVQSVAKIPFLGTNLCLNFIFSLLFGE